MCSRVTVHVVFDPDLKPIIRFSDLPRIGKKLPLANIVRLIDEQLPMESPDNSKKSSCNVKLCGMDEQPRESWSGRNSSIRLIEFSREEYPFPNRDHTWQQFHTFRNGVLDVLSSYGSVGPLGRTPILDSYEESYYPSCGGNTKGKR